MDNSQSEQFFKLNYRTRSTYASIFLISFFSWRSKKESLSDGVEVLKWGVGSSLVFFLITNFGAWLMLDMYQKNIFGLILSYWNGIPYFLYDLMGTMFYIYLALYLRQKEKIMFLRQKEKVLIK